MITKPVVNKIELAKMLRTFPIFGGEPDDPPVVADPITPPVSTGAPAGGSDPDPIAELIKDPAKVKALLESSTALNTQLAELTAKVTANDEKEAAALRATQTKEQQQATDIDNYKIEVEKRDNVIKAKALENAILNSSQYQWHSIRQLLAELDMSKLKIDIDVDKATAEVTGLEEQLKSVAEKWPHMLKTAEVADPTTPTTRQRSSGTPPRPPQAPNDKEAKRREVMKRMPVLSGASATAPR